MLTVFQIWLAGCAIATVYACWPKGNGTRSPAEDAEEMRALKKWHEGKKEGLTKAQRKLI